MTTSDSRPIVYFLGENNVEKSPMAAALTNHRHGTLLRAYSAGTACTEGIPRDPDCEAVLAEVKIPFNGAATPVDEELFRRADYVIIVSRDMNVDPVPGMRGTITRWGVEEPAWHGLTGRSRARIIRDYLIRRVDALAVGIATHDGTLRSGMIGEDILDQTGGQKSSRRVTAVV